MGTVIGLLVARGMSERVARVFSYAVLALALLGAFAGLVAAYNHHVIAAHNQKVIARAAPATNQAASERGTDAVRNTKSEQEMHDAVHSVPDALPGGPSHALACKRLRNLGRAPAACGRPQSGH